MVTGWQLLSLTTPRLDVLGCSCSDLQLSASSSTLLLPSTQVWPARRGCLPSSSSISSLPSGDSLVPTAPLSCWLVSSSVRSISVLAVTADVPLFCVFAQQLCNARPCILGWYTCLYRYLYRYSCYITATTCHITCYHMLVLYMVVLTLALTCAGELYPTEVRTTAHGMSAGVAKMGALWATIWFNYSPLTVARSVT